MFGTGFQTEANGVFYIFQRLFPRLPLADTAEDSQAFDNPCSVFVPVKRPIKFQTHGLIYLPYTRNRARATAQKPAVMP